MFLGQPSQCIYSIVLGCFDPWYFIAYGIYLCYFDPISFFRVFLPFLGENGKKVGINHNECSPSIHLWEGRNNDVLNHFCGNTIVKVKNEGNMVGI